MLIPTLTFILYLRLNRTGKGIHLAWLSMWFVTQFLSHEWYTLFGKGFMGDVAGKIGYFRNCLRLIDLPGRYVPDLYHIVWSKLVFRRQQIAGAVTTAGGSAWPDRSQREGDGFIVQLFQDFQK